MEDIASVLRHVPLFTDIEPEVVNHIASIGSVGMYKEGDFITKEKDEGNSFFIILSGKVKVSHQCESGEEIVYANLEEREFFGEMALLEGVPRSANVIALESTSVFSVTRALFLGLLKDEHEVAVSLLRAFARRLRIADMRIRALSLKSIEGKIASVIMQVAEERGVLRDGFLEIDGMPFQSDLVVNSGTSRETVTRTLRAMQKRKLIELEGSKLRILDHQGMKSLIA